MLMVLIICDLSQGVRAHSPLGNMCDHLLFVFQVEQKSIEAKNDFNQINAMQEELKSI